ARAPRPRIGRAVRVGVSEGELVIGVAARIFCKRELRAERPGGLSPRGARSLIALLDDHHCASRTCDPRPPCRAQQTPGPSTLLLSSRPFHATDCRPLPNVPSVTVLARRPLTS